MLSKYLANDCGTYTLQELFAPVRSDGEGQLPLRLTKDPTHER